MNVVLVTLLLLSLGYGLHFSFKPLPEGCSYRGSELGLELGQVEFLKDLTYVTASGQRTSQQEIFDTAFRLIDEAQSYILIDWFLFNPFLGKQEQAHRQLCRELTEHLLAKKAAQPGLAIDFITDPINLAYGGSELAELERLKSAGVNVIVTDLEELRDSNLVYSPLWRVLFAWMGQSRSYGYIQHPFSESMPPVNLRSYLAAANFKANHRKVLLTDGPDGWRSLISSANPHDASSAHSNVALLIKGDFAREVYVSEQAVAKLSHASLQPVAFASEAQGPGSLSIKLLTEQAIERELLWRLRSLGQGDELAIAMFYVSSRPVIKALKAAAGRGARIRLILDPSNDAFGRSKYGIPNQTTAYELAGCSELRWYRVSGEQFHTKLALIERRDGTSALILGSANLTRRNIAGYNLETDAVLSGAGDQAVFAEVRTYFERLWSNQGGSYTQPAGAYAPPSALKRGLTRVFEVSGWSTF